MDKRKKVIAGIAIAGLLLTTFAVVAVVLAGFAIQSTVQVADDIKPQVDKIGPQLAALDQRLNAGLGERVTTLPDDGQVWSTIFIWSADRYANPNDRKLASMFASTPELQSLLKQTYVYEYTPKDRLWAERYAKHMGGETPQIWVQRPLASNNDTADVIYKASGGNFPDTGKELAAEIQKNISSKTMNSGPCPRPGPDIKPDTPAPGPGPAVIPDIRPDKDEPAKDEGGVPAWALLIPLGVVIVFGPVLLIGLGLFGAWLAWKHE